MRRGGRRRVREDRRHVPAAEIRHQRAGDDVQDHGGGGQALRDLRGARAHRVRGGPALPPGWGGQGRRAARGGGRRGPRPRAPPPGRPAAPQRGLRGTRVELSHRIECDHVRRMQQARLRHGPLHLPLRPGDARGLRHGQLRLLRAALPHRVRARQPLPEGRPRRRRRAGPRGPRRAGGEEAVLRRGLRVAPLDARDVHRAAVHLRRRAVAARAQGRDRARARSSPSRAPWARGRSSAARFF